MVEWKKRSSLAKLSWLGQCIIYARLSKKSGKRGVKKLNDEEITLNKNITFCF
jgi:hypothetical protein